MGVDDLTSRAPHRSQCCGAPIEMRDEDVAIHGLRVWRCTTCGAAVRQDGLIIPPTPRE